MKHKLRILNGQSPKSRVPNAWKIARPTLRRKRTICNVGGPALDAGFETENERTISQAEKTAEISGKEIFAAASSVIFFSGRNKLNLRLKENIGIIHVIPPPRNFGNEKKRKNSDFFILNTRWQYCLICVMSVHQCEWDLFISLLSIKHTDKGQCSL